jgi:hypothetical protein
MSDVDPFYPAWRFHPTLPMKIVQSAAEDAALEKEWVHTPSELLAPKLPPDPPPAELSPPEAGVSPLDPTPAPKKSHHKKKEPVVE